MRLKLFIYLLSVLKSLSYRQRIILTLLGVTQHNFVDVNIGFGSMKVRYLMLFIYSSSQYGSNNIMLLRWLKPLQGNPVLPWDVNGIFYQTAGYKDVSSGDVCRKYTSQIHSSLEIYHQRNTWRLQNNCNKFDKLAVALNRGRNVLLT